MKLKLSNTRTAVVATPDESRWLYEYLSFEDGRLSYLKRKRRIHGDDHIRMYSRAHATFPGGFTAMVKRAAVSEGFSVVVEEHRVAPCIAKRNVNLGWLRDYQLTAAQIAARETRGLLWLPTGAGKTEIATALGRVLPCRWLFLVHRKTLMHQAAERFELRTGETAGRVGDEQWDEARYTVATFQTLASALKRNDPRARALLDGAHGVIVDESHTLPADSFWGVAMATRNAYWRIGMSGTPLARGDRRSVLTIGALGPVIYRVKPEVLIERGLLARPRISMVPVVQDCAAPTYQGVYGAAIVRSAKRNTTLTEIAKAAAKPSLLFVKEIKHGRALEERLRKAGIAVEFVFGNSDTARRNAAIRRLTRSDVDVLICSVIFQEGTDIPEVRSVINAAGGRSIIATLQRIGRGMRPTEGEGGLEFEVWDVADKGNGILERHTRGRRKAYEREGYEVLMLPSAWQTERARRSA